MRRPFGRAGKPPARKPHPDPRVEAELQRIISLRRQLSSWHQIAEKASADAARSASKSAHVETHGAGKARQYAERSAALRDAVKDAGERIDALHDEIAKRLEGLGDDALWLPAE